MEPNLETLTMKSRSEVLTMDPMLTMNNRIKRKRVVLTLSQKIEICRRLKAGENKHALMNDFNVGASTLYDISRQEKKLMDFAGIPALRKACEHRHTLHQPKLRELDIALFDWFEKVRSDGVQVTGPVLKEKAKELYFKLNITAKCGFTEGWLARFKMRHGINRSDLSNRPNDADTDSSEQANFNDGSLNWQDIPSVAPLTVKAEQVCDSQNYPDTTYPFEPSPIKTELRSESCDGHESDNTTDDVSWSSAAESFANILSFAEVERCFSEHELTQLHVLHSTFHYKMKKSFKAKLP